jgi:hypothetical protein
MAGVWVLPAPRFYFTGVWVRSFLDFFFNRRPTAELKALFFIAFSGFSLHGEFKHNSTYFPPKILRKTTKNHRKITHKNLGR